jgi:iron complex outermembrane receptor protein
MVCLILFGTLASNVTFAQRAAENAVTAAQDAFGTTVGNESIGLYSAIDVRGFSPTDAGNLRIDGLYFDRQGDTTNRIISGNTVRVGISAQSYPFPAPTGIADYRLRTPGDRQITSVLAAYGPFNQGSVEVDTQIPLVSEKLSMGAGIAGIFEKMPATTSSWVWNFGGLMRWRPNDNIEIIPFGAVNYRYEREAVHTILTAGPYLPPPVKRNLYYGQDWANLNTEQSVYGFTARVDLPDDWTLRAGVFRSLNYRINQAENFFRNTQPDGRTDRSVIIFPGNSLGSYSGEARISRIFVEGERRHTVHTLFRGRYKKRTFGGTTTIALGPGVIGVPDPEPLPAYTLGPSSSAKVQQGTGGVAYEGLWAGVGELGLGVQKTFYRRHSEQPGLPTITSKDRPWLLNATAAIYLRSDLAVFASYARGLEESGEAPQNAINRGESVPATRTSQIDAGFRYAITPGLRIVAGVFEVKKPFFNLDTANIFAQLGDVRHRGVEFSLTGQVIEGLTVVAGTVLLQARVTGSAVTGGRIGRVPLGRYPHVMRLNVQYGPGSWKGVAVDAQVENISARYADLLNTVRAPSYTTFNVGGRYRFRIDETSATVRLQVQNLTNTFAWTVSPTATFLPVDQRRVTLSLTADF